MKASLAALVAALIAGCAGFESLVPGQSSLAEVTAAMGAPAHRSERSSSG